MKFVLHPLSTEKAVAGIENENKITFIIRENASKPDVKKEVEEVFGEKVLAVNVMYAPDGRKKAFVRFARQGAASDLAAKLKII